jgi:sugar phosphate isomerase/epimerase
VNPRELLVDSIHRCLGEIRDDEDITLLIEPEPGMFIETIDQGLSLVDEVDSPKFRLHLDMNHNYCSEQDYIAAYERAAPYTRFLHVSDAQEGYNLKILKMAENLDLDLDFANYLIYFPDSADFLLVDPDHPMCFYDDPVSATQKKQIVQVLDQASIDKEIKFVDYNSLYAGATEFDNEVFVYLISVPAMSFDVLERAKPIISYLRGNKDRDGKPYMEKMVANTLSGIVHFHEIPGEGTMDFEASFKALTDNGFSGYASVELYHHVQSWEKALDDSFRHLSRFV